MALGPRLRLKGRERLPHSDKKIHKLDVIPRRHARGFFSRTLENDDDVGELGCCVVPVFFHPSVSRGSAYFSPVSSPAASGGVAGRACVT